MQDPSVWLSNIKTLVEILAIVVPAIGVVAGSLWAVVRRVRIYLKRSSRRTKGSPIGKSADGEIEESSAGRPDYEDRMDKARRIFVPIARFVLPLSLIGLFLMGLPMPSNKEPATVQDVAGVGVFLFYAGVACWILASSSTAAWEELERERLRTQSLAQEVLKKRIENLTFLIEQSVLPPEMRGRPAGENGALEGGATVPGDEVGPIPRTPEGHNGDARPGDQGN